MDLFRRNSIIWVIVLLVEALILKLAKSMRLWIYIALPILAGFAAVELLNSETAADFFRPKKAAGKRNLK